MISFHNCIKQHVLYVHLLCNIKSIFRYLKNAEIKKPVTSQVDFLSHSLNATDKQLKKKLLIKYLVNYWLNK